MSDYYMNVSKRKWEKYVEDRALLPICISYKSKLSFDKNVKDKLKNLQESGRKITENLKRHSNAIMGLSVNDC